MQIGPDVGPVFFGAFAPGAAPDAPAALRAAMGAAVPDGAWTGEDLTAPGLAAALRWPGAVDAPAPLRARIAKDGDALCFGLVELIRRPDAAVDALAAAGADRLPDIAALGDDPDPRIEGRWATARYAPAAPGRPARLTLLRDPFGRLPLWTAAGPGGALLFASHPAALLAAPGVSRAPDLVSLALMLTFRDCGPGHSPFEGVKEVPRGARLVAEGPARRILPAAPLRPDPAVAALSPDDALQALHARGRAAVAGRIALAEATGRAPAIQLSGGLDSALIALWSEGRGPLPAFAAVPAPMEGDDYNAGAEAAARAAVTRALGLELTEIGPEGADFLAGAQHHMDRAAMPCPDPAGFAGLHVARRMEEAGIGAALNGMGGDFCLSSHARPTLAEWFAAGGPRAMAEEIAARRARGGRLRNILIGDLVKPSAAFAAWMRLRPGDPDAELAAGMARSPALAARMAEAGRAWRRRRLWSMAAEEAAELGRLPAWTVQDLAPLPGGGRMGRMTPLLDLDLLRAVLAMPPELRLFPAEGEPGGRTRGLARRLLAGRLPQVAARPDKAPFQPDYARLQAAAIPRIRAEGRAFRTHPAWAEIVDAARWDAALDAAEKGGVREGIALSNKVMMPYFIGWWLLRIGG
ncbi:asparagine synthase-related protein [Rhodovulum sp. DZ06]|uniref:asparagine synthase-related protein n=1 Tax=Rhodovulum sp. DZ06 TaxID=3425126 RepID=UPI003D346A83